VATAPPKRSIFRSKAVQKYVQNREKSVLPVAIAPPVFAFCWVLLTLLTTAGIVAWLGQVPLYITGAGIVLDQNISAHQGDEAMAIIFLPTGEISHLRIGLPVQVQIGQTGPQLNRSIDAINQNVFSPEQVRLQYGLGIAEPSVSLTVVLGSTISGPLYAGSLVQAQIQIGSQSLLSLFPVFDSLLKNK